MTDYTGFSGNPAQQEGNYIVFHAEVPEEEDVTITAKITETSTLDADGIAVFRVTDKTKPLVITATKTGYDPIVKTFDLSGLTLNQS